MHDRLEKIKSLVQKGSKGTMDALTALSGAIPTVLKRESQEMKEYGREVDLLIGQYRDWKVGMRRGYLEEGQPNLQKINASICEIVEELHAHLQPQNDENHTQQHQATVKVDLSVKSHLPVNIEIRADFNSNTQPL
ncbi:MAG: hypothetical protein AAF570_12580 [Bacteroidota bacterium]